MIKQFYEMALPTQGVYCVTGIDPATGATKNRFTETLKGVHELIADCNKRKQNTFVAVSTFEGYSRKAKDALFCKSLFVDLDVGAEKAKKNEGYTDSGAALIALDVFITESGLPPPVIVSSGHGVHAYWLFDKDIPTDEYLTVAQLFKDYCVARLFCDRAVMADMARIMRCPDSMNYKTDPPTPTGFISEDLNAYSFESFKEFLGVEEEPEEPANDVAAILASIPKGLDDETRAFKKLDNFKYNFRNIVIRSLEGDGCNQIAEVARNPENPPYSSWTGALAVAVRCEDGEEAIQLISEGHRDYTPEKTITKANSFNSIRTCEGFARDEPSLCEGCKHRGRIVGPIELGREFIPAAAAHTEDTVWEKPDTKKLQELPGFLRPFVKGTNGGIYFMPPATVDKETKKKTQDDPVLFLAHDLWPIRRLYSKTEGECLLMRLVLPHDPAREFLLPVAQSAEDIRKAVVAQGSPCEPSQAPRLYSYISKWNQYMINVYKADQIRTQMGWTEKINPESPVQQRRSFVLGSREINEEGQIIESATSPLIRGIARHLEPQGTYEKWRWCVDHLNQPGFEMHAFAMLCSFGSTLMEFTSTAGVTVSLQGLSGCGKTGGMYAGLSAFGHPVDLSVLDSTDNGMVGRYLGLHSLMLAVDEVGEKKAETLASLIHKVSQGKAKIKMQASVNAEREYELTASLICMMTTNHSIYDKLVAYKNSPVGEAARLVEFAVIQPVQLTGEMGQAIFNPLKFNYGFAGPMFIQEVYRIGDAAVYQELVKWQMRFVKDFGDPPSNRFFKNLMAVFAAGSIGNGANVFKYDLERIYQYVLMQMINIRDNVAPANRTDYPSILNEYINNHVQNVLIVEGDMLKLSPRNSLVARIDTETGVLQVSKTEFKKHLAELQVSSANFEREMSEMFVDKAKQKPRLIGSKKSRLAAGWKDGVGGNIWNYHFNIEVPDEILGLVDDTKSNT